MDEWRRVISKMGEAGNFKRPAVCVQCSCSGGDDVVQDSETARIVPATGFWVQASQLAARVGCCYYSYVIRDPQGAQE